MSGYKLPWTDPTGFQLPALSQLVMSLAGYEAAKEDKPRVPSTCQQWHTMVKYYTDRNPDTFGISIPISEAWLRGYDQRRNEEAAEAIR